MLWPKATKATVTVTAKVKEGQRLDLCEHYLAHCLIEHLGAKTKDGSEPLCGISLEKQWQQMSRGVHNGLTEGKGEYH